MSGLAIRAAAAAQVVVDDLTDPQLDDSDAHHLIRVLRIRTNEQVVASDGAGHWRLCRLQGSNLTADTDIVFEERVLPPISVGFALTKGDKPELVIQKLTEVGVDVIAPVIAEHTVVRWSADKAKANAERFRRVALEAAMQSRRVWLPEVHDIVTLADVPAEERVLAHASEQSEPISLDRPCVFVGPEGGWSAREIAGAAGLVDLGPSILRAETAAIAAAVQLAFKRHQRTFRP